MNVNDEAPAQAGAFSIMVSITRNGYRHSLEQPIPEWITATSDVAGVAYELAVSIMMKMKEG